MSSPSVASAVTNTTSQLLKNEHESTDKTCVVCFKIVDIFSIGECDHPVCYECSTRMRVLCQQNECPICRGINQKVIFTSEILTYRELDLSNRSGLYNKTFRIAFTGQRAMNAFQRLLEHPCSKCGTEFPTAAALRDHLRKVHELFYCDICTENLKIFSFERKAYTRELLALHRRKGDPDNTSHRGHPLCEYCDERYLDRDELFRHLRRDHFYCHFCDLDGTGTNNFYADHQSLRDHFIDQHYLCEEGECKSISNIFTASFRSDIDLKAHKASVHGQTSRHARTINFDFPRSANNSRGNRYDDADEYEQSNPLPRTPVIDARNEQDFPSLGNGPSVPMRQNIPLNNRVFGTKGLAKTKENFPALGGSTSNTAINLRAVPLSAPSTSQETASALLKYPQKSIATKPKVNLAQPTAIKSKPALNNSVADFPSLPGGLGNPLASNKATKKFAAAVIKAKALPPVKVISTKQTPSLHRTLSDYPSLSGISAQNNRKDLEEDFIDTTPNFSMANLSAKHRALVPSYESISFGQSSSKINTIQRTEVEKTSPTSNERTPVLNSKSFPALGGSSAAATAPQWLNNNTAKSKKQPQISKKLKVAPAPLLDHATNERNVNKQKTEVEKQKIESEKQKTEVEMQKTDNKQKTKTDKNKENTVETTKKNSKNDKKKTPKSEAETSHKTKEKENNNKSSGKSNKAKETNSNKRNEDTNGKDTILAEVKRVEHANELANSSNENIFSNVSASLPPPGFSGNGQVKPPPGFSSTGSKQSAVAYEYMPPSNATQRNQILVSFFQKTLKIEVVEEFRNYSKLFRENMCGVETFYEHCELTLGAQFCSVFPELLSLLPDINKQQELFNVYIQRHPKPEVVLLSLLRICEICKQVVKQSDFADHLQLHSKANLKQNFPKLGINGVTKK